MTQPPDESEASPPDEGWQAPGPAPVPPRYPGYGPPYDPPEQPQGQNPCGGGPTSYYQPIDSGAMSSTAKVVLGAVLGLCAGIFLWIVAAILFSAGDVQRQRLLVLRSGGASRGASAAAHLAGDPALGGGSVDGDRHLLDRDVRAVRVAVEQLVRR